MVQHFSTAETELSTQNPISRKNILKNAGEIKIFSDERKVKKLLPAGLP